jgi:hypothetical protein
MLKKLNTFLRLVVVCLLIFPFPVLAEDVSGEVTVNEAFDDSTYETGLTISGGSSDAYIYCSEQGRYGTTGCSLAINNGTYVFEFSEDVYEVGFIVGAVNNSYDVKYYYSDSTDETIQKSAQSWGTDGNDMYDNFYKSFTDYNNDEANTDKFITKFEVTISDISVLDTLYWQYVDESTIPTTTTTSSTTTSTTTTSSTTSSTTTTLSPEDIERNNNQAETGYYETDAERKAREDKEAAEAAEAERKRKEEEAERARLKAIEDEKNKNYSETGYYETDKERADREYQEEQDRLAELQRQRDANFAETGYYETDDERAARELAEEQARIEEEIKNTVVIKTDGEELTEEEQKEIDELVDAIIEIQETIDFEEYEVEEEIIEIEFEDIPEEIILVLPEEEIKDETPIKEVFDEDESIPVESDITEDVVTILDTTDREGEEVELTEEQVEEIIEVIEEAEVEKVVEILEEVVIEEVTEEQVEIVQAVVDKVVEEVEDLSVEEQEVVAEVLGFTEVEDVEIIAEAVESDEVVAEAVAIFVEKAVENKDVEDYTLADAVTEVKVSQFLDNPINAIVDIDLTDFKVSELGQDMTNDQREKSKEVVVPVIIASQIIASASVIPVRRIK